MFSYQKAQVVKKYAQSELDTGSTEVQVALLSYRIKELTEHFKIHKKDHHGRMGLIKMVSRRKRLLKYLSKSAPERYQKLIDSLELRK